MKEFVIPTLPSISDTDFEEDLLMAESLREKWCTYVGQPDIEGVVHLTINIVTRSSFVVDTKRRFHNFLLCYVLF